MKLRAFSFRTDERTLIALARLANNNSRSRSKQIEFLIRQAALREGCWELGAVVRPRRLQKPT